MMGLGAEGGHVSSVLRTPLSILAGAAVYIVLAWITGESLSSGAYGVLSTVMFYAALQ